MNKDKIDFTYLTQPPKRFTFQQPKLKQWVESKCIGKVLNLFAGKIKLRIDEFRVDANKNMIADWYGDALDFINSTNMKFDTVILDPPYSLRKSYEKYEGYFTGSNWTKIKRALPRILNNGARIITFGYNSQGMSKSNGCRKIEICLVCHNGDHNDTIVMLEEFDLKNIGLKQKFDGFL